MEFWWTTFYDVFFVGLIYQTTEIRKIQDFETNSTEIKVPIFIFVGTMVSAAGVIGFGRPYRPFCITLVGLVGTLIVFVVANALMD
jgi:hypothetical protein